jgi:hypothetical protein
MVVRLVAVSFIHLTGQVTNRPGSRAADYSQTTLPGQHRFTQKSAEFRATPAIDDLPGSRGHFQAL